MIFAERFWSKVDRRGPDECWPWLAARAGGRDGQSYGYFGIKRGEMDYAHRVAFRLDRGIDSIPDGIVIRHSCDNGICCNPGHLIDGTQADNVADMVKRGRQRKGEAISNAILIESDIPVIRSRLAAREYHHIIAADYGVSRATISQIARGHSWAWVL